MGSSVNFTWEQFWSYFKRSDDEIKRENWEQLLNIYIRDIPKKESPSIAKEILEHAPEDVKRYLKFSLESAKVVEVSRAKNNKPDYRNDLLESLSLLESL